MKKKFTLHFLCTILGLCIIVCPILFLYLHIETKTILSETKKESLEDIKTYIAEYDLAIYNAENAILEDYTKKLSMISDDLLKGGPIEKLAYDELRDIAIKYDIENISLVNEEGIVFNTTYTEKTNTNFFATHSSDSELLRDLYGKASVYTRNATVTNHNKLNKYLYFSPENTNFIIQLSINIKKYISNKHGEIYTHYLFGDRLKKVIGSNTYLTNVKIYDVTTYTGWCILLDGCRLKDSKRFIENMNNKDYMVTDKSNTTIYTLLEDLKELHTYHGRDLLIEMNYDFSALNNFIKKIIIFIFLTGLFLVFIFFAILSKIFNTTVTNRILAINQNLNQVEKGIYPENISFEEKDEIFDIASNINKMKEKIYERELQLKNKVDELQKITNQLKKAEEALAYDKLKTEFFSNMSHEFKTPLNILLSSMQLIELFVSNGKIKDPEKKLTHYIKSMKQNAYRLLRLTNNLIDMTKIDAYFYEIEAHNYDIVKVVENIVLSTIEYGKSRNIQISFTKQIDKKLMACDPDKIERIVLNLLSNAIKFTNTSGKIEVTIRQHQNHILIIVKDYGIGIPTDKLDIIFQRFRQADKSFTRNAEGSGIGLSLVKSLVELHNGTISVSSTLGKGSEFTVALPIVVLHEISLPLEQDLLEDRRIEKMKIEFSDIYF